MPNEAPDPSLPTESERLAEALDAALPQTQCTRCGYTGCRPYARAIAAGEAGIDRCPPGGTDTIVRLAALTGQAVKPLDPACGVEGPRLLARIESHACIGCTKCILACPVDAVIGGPGRMHTVMPSLCSGCELCVPPCPVDCIRIEALPAAVRWTDADARAARMRFDARAARLRARGTLTTGGTAARQDLPAASSSVDTSTRDDEAASRRARVAEAMAIAATRRRNLSVRP